ncbi:MAG: sulfatase [Gemmatimonadota bacterium]|jgi:arylsulfatase A-like enzyme|nr:sulfatase [Gemmatimonadota bacterium]MDP7031185.1 sulfatase [Gemmatimonadota bacterium]
MISRAVFRVAWVAFASAAVLLSGCESAPPAPGVVVILVDTLRPDRLGCYGADRPTSPSIDRLASESVRFTRARATAPWTLPSAASLLTGLYPSAHGARTTRSMIREDAVLLAEVFRAEGFATGAVVSHVFVGSKFGFGRGFDVFLEAEAQGHSHISTDGVTREAIALLEEYAASGASFFLLVHYFDPHDAYLDFEGADFAKGPPGRIGSGMALSEVRWLPDGLSPDEERRLRDLYDEEILRTDGGIGRLLNAVDTTGLSARTTVLLTADHGEEFHEHGRRGHGRTVYEELMRVPLMVREPGGTPGTVDAPVSLASVAPSLLELAGLDPAALGAQTPSLVPYLRGETVDAPDRILCESDYVAPERLRALVSGRYKLVRELTTGSSALYDLVADPGELRDLSGASPQVTARMEAELEQELRRVVRAGRGRGVSLTPEKEEMLRGLGYVE